MRVGSGSSIEMFAWFPSFTFHRCIFRLFPLPDEMNKLYKQEKAVPSTCSEFNIFVTTGEVSQARRSFTSTILFSVMP